MPHIIEITSLEAPELRWFAGLTEPQLRSRRDPAQGIFIAESLNVISAALEAGCRPLALLTERKHITGKAADLIARCGDIPVYTGDSDLLRQLTGFALSRSVLCAMGRPVARDMAAVCENAGRLAVLEGLTDAANVGAIFRSAAALGVDGVLLAPGCCDPLNRRAVRVSMGTVLQIPWATAPDWPEGLHALKALGFRTAALALDHRAIPLDHPALRQAEKLALVLGAEGNGLKPETVAACDYTVMIPMHRGVDSLNVAAAAAVAFWELRQISTGRV